MSFLKVKVLFPSYVFETRGLVKLGRLYVEDLILSSWWSILAVKIAVSVIFYLVSDMDTDAKSKTRQNTLGNPFSLFSLS